jgi:hypothetical protein
MKKTARLLFFGFLSWLVTFTGALALAGIRESQPPLFETLMGPVLVASTAAFTLIYLRRVGADYLREAAELSLAFVGCNILLDLPMFLEGPMKMPLVTYLKEIGLAYLSMPIIALAIAWQGQRRDTLKTR